MTESTVGVAARKVKRFPKGGQYTIDEWCEQTGVTDETFREWLRVYDIPYKQWGNLLVVDADDFWRSQQPQKMSEAPPSKRGGNRRKLE